MGRRGPKPTPTPILKLRGSWRGNVRGDDLSLDQKRPQRPVWLVGEAKKCWERLVPILHKAGLATELNRETLALLCSAWADYVEADRQLAAARNEDGGRALLIKTDKGGVMENPLLYVRKRAFEQVMKVAACYGLTPADLSSVRAVEKPPEAGTKSKFFHGTG
jgi:P27 family predicted phage terminase small subunit